MIAVVAAIFGFGGVSSTAESAAQLIFDVAIILLIICLVMNYRRRAAYRVSDTSGSSLSESKN